MKATVAKMKANLANVKDPAAKEQDQQNVELWEAMTGHMEGMLKMMEAHGGPMGMMGMHHEMGEHHGMEGCCGGMHHEGMGEHHEAMGGCCGGMKEGAGCCGGNKCGGEKAPPAPMDKDKPAAPPSN
jgi:hypothetical protein